jgi:hypothetical protein
MKNQLLQKIDDFVFSVIFASIPFLFFLGLLVIAGTARGAPNVDVEREIEITDEVIARVEDALPDNPSATITGNLDMACGMQADAHTAFDGGEYMLALGFTRQARQIALGIERMLASLDSHENGPPDAVLRILEQNAEMIEELAPAVDEFGDDFIREDFANVVEMQDRAWQEFNEENYDIAGMLAQAARDRLIQIKKATLEVERRFGPEQVISELERARELVSYAREKAFPEAIESVELLSVAEGMLNEAEMLHSDGRPREAMRFLDEVIVLSKRSVEISRHGGLRADRMEEELVRTEEMIENAREMLEIGSPEQAGEMLSQSEELLMEARSAFGNGSVEEAGQLIIESRRLADLASRSAKGSGDINRWNVEKAIDNTNNILDHVSGPLEELGAEEGLHLLSRARELQEEARGYLENDRYREALTSTRAAADAAIQASKMSEIK